MATATSDDAGSELTTTTTTSLAPEPPFVPVDPRQAGLTFEPYTSEARLQAMADLIAKDLSEPYSVYTYRYFVNEWPQLSETVRTRTPQEHREERLGLTGPGSLTPPSSRCMTATRWWRSLLGALTCTATGCVATLPCWPSRPRTENAG